MKTLTNEQYEELLDFARSHGMRLNGYQVINEGILLNNSIHDGVFGKSLQELKDAIIKYSRK